MGMLIDREEAVQVIGEARMALLRTCLDDAWSTYERHFRPQIPLASPIGMANVLRELVVQQVRDRFAGLDGVRIREEGRFLVQIDDRLILSFKKLTTDFQTSNNPTDTSRAFDAQEEIDGLQNLPRVTVGYQLGHYGTSLSGLYIAFVVGQECVWNVDLRTGESTLEFEFPQSDDSAADQERKSDEDEKRRQDGDEEVTGSD